MNGIKQKYLLMIMIMNFKCLQMYLSIKVREMSYFTNPLYLTFQTEEM